MKRTVLFAGIIGATLSMPAFAATAGNEYFGFGINLWDIGVETPYDSGSAEPKGIEGRYGFFINDNFAIEGRLGVGIGDDAGIEISRNFGFYFKAVASSEGFKPYAFMGYTDLELEVGNLSETDNDISYGIGASFGSGNTRFNFEWARLYSDESDGIGIDIDTMQFGVVTGF